MLEKVLDILSLSVGFRGWSTWNPGTASTAHRESRAAAEDARRAIDFVTRRANCAG